MQAAGACIAGAEAAGGIVIRPLLGGRVLHLPLPGAHCAVRRHEQPLAGERIQPAVWR